MVSRRMVGMIWGLRRDGQVSFCALSDHDNWTEGELSYVADRMVPNAIRGVGELLRVFYKYADVPVGPTVTWRVGGEVVDGSPMFLRPWDDTGAIPIEVRLVDNGNGIDREATYIEWRGESDKHPGVEAAKRGCCEGRRGNGKSRLGE